MEEAKKAYDNLKKTLKDDKLLTETSDNLFASIAKEKSKSFDVNELAIFMQKVVEKMGVKHTVNKDKIKELFEKLDRDKSKSLSKEETRVLVKVVLKQYKKHYEGEMEKHGWKKPSKPAKKSKK